MILKKFIMMLFLSFFITSTIYSNALYANVLFDWKKKLLEIVIEQGIDYATDKLTSYLSEGSSNTNLKTLNNTYNSNFTIFVGKNKYKYKLNTTIKSYGGKVELVSGYLTNNKGKIFNFYECSGNENIIDTGNFKYYDCSYSWTQDSYYTTFYIREGRSLWSFTVSKNGKVNDGLVFNVDDGKFQAMFDGYRNF